MMLVNVTLCTYHSISWESIVLKFVLTHSATFKCGGLMYTSILSKFSWPLCWYNCNFRESENNVWPPELASWPPRMKKDKVLDILAVSECRIIPATCRSWSFFEPMLMIYIAQWEHLQHIEKSAKFENCSVGLYKGRSCFFLDQIAVKSGIN